MNARAIWSACLAANLMGCAAAPRAAAPPSAPASMAEVASPSTAVATPRAYEPLTLPSGDGPVPGAVWEKGRPFWLDGELLPKSASARDGFDPRSPELLRERSLFTGTRAMATVDRFAWGAHACTAPTYEQRVVSLETYNADHNYPSPSPNRRFKELWWEVRVTCAPGKGDVALSLFRVIREGSKLDHEIAGLGEKLHVHFQPVREIESEAVLPAPEPGTTLVSGEGPLPGREWEPGRPAWLEGDLATRLVLARSRAELASKARERQREALGNEHLSVTPRRVAFAGRVCAEPRFEQKLVKHLDWLAEQHAGGGGLVAQEDWVVRIRCAKGKGDLGLELARGIPKGKPDDHVVGFVQGFDVSFDLPKAALSSTKL